MCHIKLHVLLYVTFKILQFMTVEEIIASTHSNQDQLIQALQEKLRDFGLTKNESKIYLFLSKKGPKKAIEIATEEKIPRTETYHLLSTLESKGIVSPSIQRPTRFSAVQIEKAIEAIIQNNLERIEKLKLLKDDMIELWNFFQNIEKNNKSNDSKLKSKLKKYDDGSTLKTDFKKKVKEMRRKSDMANN